MVWLTIATRKNLIDIISGITFLGFLRWTRTTIYPSLSLNISQVSYQRHTALAGPGVAPGSQQRIYSGASRLQNPFFVDYHSAALLVGREARSSAHKLPFSVLLVPYEASSLIGLYPI